MSTVTYDNRTSDPDAPDSGKVKVYIKDKVPHWKDDTGLVSTMTAPVFGTNFDLSIEEDYTMTTSGTTWSTYAGLTMPANKDGTYLVLAHCMTRMSTTGSDIRFRLAKNGTTLRKNASEEFKDSNNAEIVPRMLMRKVTLAEGDFLDMDFATEGGTVTVKEASIYMWRVA